MSRRGLVHCAGAALLVLLRHLFGCVSAMLLAALMPVCVVISKTMAAV